MNRALDIHSNLNGETLPRFKKISKIECYFTTEIKEREAMSKRLNKYIPAFDYIDKIFIVSAATSVGTSIISFSSIIGTPVGIASASFSLLLSLATGIIKKLLKTTRYIKKA